MAKITVMNISSILKDINDSYRNSSRLFQKLSDGRAYTLIELSNDAKMNRKTTLEILDKLVGIGVLQTRGNRNRMYYFRKNPATDNLTDFFPEIPLPVTAPSGMKYSRHCYNHLAGTVGVRVTEALLKTGFLRESEDEYLVTPKGWQWLKKIGIHKADFDQNRDLTKKCLDFSERRSHLGGQLGDALLSTLLDQGWANHVPYSREIRITKKGISMLASELGLELIR